MPKEHTAFSQRSMIRHMQMQRLTCRTPSDALSCVTTGHCSVELQHFKFQLLISDSLLPNSYY
jgi:hypothetical protein